MTARQEMIERAIVLVFPLIRQCDLGPSLSEAFVQDLVRFRPHLIEEMKNHFIGLARSQAVEKAVKSVGMPTIKMLWWYVREGPICDRGKTRTLASYPGVLADIRAAFRREMSP